MYRLNTYPLIHIGFVHVFLNTISIVPLLERFEAEHGTLLTAAFFGGRKLWLLNVKRENRCNVTLSIFDPTWRCLYFDRKRYFEGQYSYYGRKVQLSKKSSHIYGLTSSSVWIFVLLGAEAIQAFRANPHFALVMNWHGKYIVLTNGRIGTNRIPTWTTPLILLLFVSALVPNTSFLGQLCSVGEGYACQAMLGLTTVITVSREAPADAFLSLRWARIP